MFIRIWFVIVLNTVVAHIYSFAREVTFAFIIIVCSFVRFFTYIIK